MNANQSMKEHPAMHASTPKGRDWTAPQGRHSIAQGNALGKPPAQTVPALKGRNQIAAHACAWFVGAIGCALSGLISRWNVFPRALPWAVELRPVGAGRFCHSGLNRAHT